MVIDVNAGIRTKKSWLAILVNADLTERGKARDETKKCAKKGEILEETLSFSDQFFTRAMGKKTGRIDFPTRETSV